LSRHELKSQDEITSTLQRFTEMIYDRKKEILTVVGVVAIVGLAVLGWVLYSANRNANAQAQLSTAINFYNDTTIPTDKERFEKALAEAQKTYDAYASTSIGPIAKYYVGMSKEGLGDTAGAIQNLQEVAGTDDEAVRSVAQFALGSIYKKSGDYPKAIEVYKQLYDTGGYSKSAVTLELAELHEASNQLDQAKDYYQKVISDFPDSPFRTRADEALKRLGVTPAATPAANPS
jgi:tetratricopeptide (TPR) repeat protein